LQAKPEILKLIETPNQLNRNKNVLKKTMFGTSKWKGPQNLYGGYPTDFAGLTQNPKKNCRNSKSTNQNNIFSKKVFSVP
jgi:hypothetical protein